MIWAERAIADLEALLSSAKGNQREAIEQILARLRSGANEPDFVDVRLPPRIGAGRKDSGPAGSGPGRSPGRQAATG